MQEILAGPEIKDVATTMAWLFDGTLVTAILYQGWRLLQKPFHPDYGKLKTPGEVIILPEGQAQADEISKQLTNQTIRNIKILERKAARAAAIAKVEADNADAEYGEQGGDSVKDRKHGWRPLN